MITTIYKALKGKNTEIKKIRNNLTNDLLKKNINEKNIHIIYKLFEYYPGKVISNVRKGDISIDDAMILFEAIIPLYEEIIEQNFKFDDSILFDFKKMALLAYPVKIDNNYDKRKKYFYDFVLSTLLITFFTFLPLLELLVDQALS